MNKFGIVDYKKMYSKYGLKLVLFYFIENHLFDIVNKTDTHKRLPIKDFPYTKNLMTALCIWHLKSGINETHQL